MKVVCHLPTLCALPVLLAGCSGREPPPADVVRPVKTFLVTGGDELHLRSFPAKVDASRRAVLAFRVPGLLVKLPVKEGQRVAEGDLIAQLRTDEFEARLKTLQGQLDQARAALQALRAGGRTEQRRKLEAQVRAAEARLANARSDYIRAVNLLRSRAFSRAEFDQAETAFRVAQEDLKAARETLEKAETGRDEDIEAQEAGVRSLEARVVEAAIQLEDCTLLAPYDGVIAQRFVEPGQNVKAQQEVVKFQDVEEIDVVVDVPETVMAADLRSADIVEMTAAFSAAPGLEFPVQLREIAQRADPVTQTFQVRVGMAAPEGVNLLPGMTASVTIGYRRAGVLGERNLVPITALAEQPSGGQVVWVLDKDGTVSPRTVKVGSAAGDRVEVLEGVGPGDLVVAAGVRFLREGMKVRDLGDALGGGRP